MKKTRTVRASTGSISTDHTTHSWTRTAAGTRSYGPHRFRPDNNDIEEVIRPLKVGLNNYGYCHNHDAAYRAAMIYSFIATCNKADVNPKSGKFH